MVGKKWSDDEQRMLEELCQRWWEAKGQRTLAGRLMAIPLRAERALLSFLDRKLQENRELQAKAFLRGRDLWVVHCGSQGQVFLSHDAAESFRRRMSRERRAAAPSPSPPTTPTAPDAELGAPTPTSDPAAAASPPPRPFLQWTGPVPLESKFDDDVEGPSIAGLISAGLLTIAGLARLIAGGAK